MPPMPPFHDATDPSQDPPLYLALVGPTPLTASSPRKFFLLLPEDLADRIDDRVAGSRNTAFIVFLQTALDFLLAYKADSQEEVHVYSAQEITPAGYQIPSRVSDKIIPLLRKPPEKKLLEGKCLVVSGRINPFDRKPFPLLLPSRLAEAIDAKMEGARNTALIVLLSLGVEIFRRRAQTERTVPIVRVGEFFKAQGYERKDVTEKKEGKSSVDS